MGERLRRLTMRSFRGVPGELTVDFGEGHSIAVYGDNGTGKSTIADALEWFFTGEIELLSHEGRQHAIRNLGGGRAGETSVELATSGELGGKVLFPDERGPEAFGIASRETFLLRGRTLADFINKSKTEKWKSLVEILGLDVIEKLRQDLQRARGEIKKRVKSSGEKLDSCRRALAPDGSPVSEEDLLAGLQQICRGLGVEVPASLDRVADPVWLAALGGEAGAEPGLESLLSGLRPVAIDADALRAWNEAVLPERSGELARLALVRDADAFLSSAGPQTECPLCGQSTDGRELAERVRTLLSELLDASRAMESAREGLRELVDELTRTASDRRTCWSRGGALGMELPEPPSLPGELSEALDRRAPVDAAGLERFARDVARWDEAAKAEAARAAAARSSDQRRSQLAMLATLSERIKSWRTAERELATAKRALALAEGVYDSYQKRQKKQLEDILGRISRRVAEIYDGLHPGENLGGITVEPWTAKGVELAVEFHGSRQRPPHGVLSESHLNSLAIALFLSMAQTFNEKLRFLVLDDVINSFDAEHRAQLASLLAEKFDDWQLVVLTHDHQFFEHLSRRAPSWKRLEITSWSYDEGPRTSAYDTEGLLGEARGRLEAGDPNGAATKARRALEELLQEVCEKLRAELAFRRGTANDRRELGELFKGIRRALKQHAKGMVRTVEPLLKNLEADVQATLNVEAHASRGRSSASEVEAALRRIDELDGLWSCAHCGTRIWHKGTPDASRCKCGKTIFPPPA